MILNSLGRQEGSRRKGIPEQGNNIYKNTKAWESVAYTGNTKLVWLEVGGMGRGWNKMRWASEWDHVMKDIMCDAKELEQWEIM